MKRTLSSQSGAAMVEFAIIAPLLLLLVFGIIEFSLLMYNKAMLTNASREGARRGVVYRVDPSSFNYQPLTDSEIQSEVSQYLSNYLITLKPPSTHSTTISRTTEAAGRMLTVQVSYPYQFLVVPPLSSIVGSGGGALPGTINLSAFTKMRME